MDYLMLLAWIFGIATGIMAYSDYVYIMTRIRFKKSSKLITKKVRIGQNNDFSVYSIVLRYRKNHPGFYQEKILRQFDNIDKLDENALSIATSYEKVLRQFDHLDELVRTVVSIVTSYELVKYYGRSEILQAPIDAFAENVKLYNMFISRADVLSPGLFKEAAVELKAANQHALDAIGKLKNQIMSELENSDRQLIYFKNPSSY